MMKIRLRKGSVVTCVMGLWLWKFFKWLAIRPKPRNVIDSYSLTDHLLDDLGFDQEGNPVSWSSYRKSPSFHHKTHALKTKRCKDNIMGYRFEKKPDKSY